MHWHTFSDGDVWGANPVLFYHLWHQVRYTTNACHYFVQKLHFFLVKVTLDKAIIAPSIDKFSGLLCFFYIKFLIYFDLYEFSSNDGYIAREEMMALLQNCLNLSGQEEEGEDGIKVASKSSLIHRFLFFHFQHLCNIGCKQYLGYILMTG